MKTSGKALKLLLAVLLCAAVVWGIFATVRNSVTTKHLTEEQARSNSLSEQVAALEAEADGRDKEIARLEDDNAALTAQLEELNSQFEERVAAEVEARYPALVEENTRFKAQDAAQLGETLLEEETDAAEEG